MDLVWDAPRDQAVTGYEINWRAANESVWQTLSIPPLTRWHIEGLVDGQGVKVRIRSERGETRSPWTAEQSCVPGAVTGSSVFRMFGRTPLRALVKVVGLSFWSLVRAKFQK